MSLRAFGFLRGAVGGSSRLYRPFSTTCYMMADLVSHSPITETNHSTDEVLAGLNAEMLITQSSQQDPNTPSTSMPFHLPLSSLLRPAPDSPPPSSNLIPLAPSIFSHPIRRDILHLCIVHHLDSLRQGTAANKSRGEVVGSGRKLRRQKGSGKARVGDAASPTREGGGRAFAKKARDFSTKLPRKVREMGMRVGLSAKVRERMLGVVESLEWRGVKTKELLVRLRELGWVGGKTTTLFVSGREGGVAEGLRRSGANVEGIDSVEVEELTVYDLLKFKRIILDLDAVKWFETHLGKEAVAE